MVQEIVHMKLTSIAPNARMVCTREDLDELCRSIRVEGQREPIVLWFSHGAFRIVDGEKRWRACKKLKMLRIKAVFQE